MGTPGELDAMRRAIALSAFGLGTTSPNPPVGCVILDVEGRIAGEGYHQRKGESHAEVHALAAAGERAKGGTAVVTLEPCNHHGRTPPCHQALLDAGITRTIVALLDPTSRGEGGVSRLRKAGIDVEVGVLADEALLVLGPWLTALQTCRPHVVWPYTLSAEGVPGSLATIPDGTQLLSGVDAVLYEDGQVAEAVPNSHGEGALSLAPVSLEAGPHSVLSTLYQGGVRSLLLNGGLPLAAPFLVERLVDSVVCYLLPTEASTQPMLDGLPELVLLPTGFRLTHVTRYKQYVRLSGVPDGSGGAT